MILKRKIYAKLLDWKNTSGGRTALMVDGARRIGKSYIAELFAQREYKSYLLIDFNRPRPGVIAALQEDSNDLDFLFARLSALYGVKLHRRESLIIFDEVQLFPRARALIKYLVADGRYDYLETGSLISLKANIEGIVIPSEEEHLEMFPLDFEEFLWALGDETSYDFMGEAYESLRPVGQALNRKFLNLFRQYLLVGGMPAAVVTYLEQRDFAEVDRIKRGILKLYRDDIGRYAKGYEMRVRQIFDEIPGQLSKKEKKYRLSSISKSARSREYEDAFVWLNDAMITNPCFNSTDPNVGLSLNLDATTHKLYMGDTGLLVTHAFWDDGYTGNAIYKAVLADKLSVNEGMLMENVVAQTLRSAGRKLFFYSCSGKTSGERMEIDFLIKRGKKICPIEVKSSEFKAHSSLDKFIRKYPSRIGTPYILYTKDVMRRDGVVHLPIYMSSHLVAAQNNGGCRR